jgi:hypothetical protein
MNTNFISKIEFSADLSKMLEDYHNFISKYPWPDTMYKVNGKSYQANQLGLTFRPNAENKIGDAGGNLFDKKTFSFTGRESDFTEWNNVGDYTKQKIKELEIYTGNKFGRIRYMRLMPKTGLSVHADFEKRFHYVLETNENAFFGEVTQQALVKANCYHLPSDSHFYKVDTTKKHFVYNGGWQPRIHLVLCSVPNFK